MRLTCLCTESFPIIIIFIVVFIYYYCYYYISILSSWTMCVLYIGEDGGFNLQQTLVVVLFLKQSSFFLF